MIPQETRTDRACAAGPREADPHDVLAILDRHASDGSELISILADIQARYRYLPGEALALVAEKTGRSLVDVYAAATFYRSFSLKPKGKHLVSVCLGTACHVRGAPTVADEFARQLGIAPGDTTPDQEFTLETMNCLGACALGPVVVIDGRYFSKVRKSRVKQLIGDALDGFDSTDAALDKRIFPVDVSCPACGVSLLDKSVTIDDYPSVRVEISLDGKTRWLRLSSLYGSHNVLLEEEIPVGAVASFSCPHCRGGLETAEDCPMCDAPMVLMGIRGGGSVQICSRRGCTNHMLDLS